MNKSPKKKRKSEDQPLCKYGASCYRQNPEHLKKFKHPTKEASKAENVEVSDAQKSPEISDTDIHDGMSSFEDPLSSDENDVNVCSKSVNPNATSREKTDVKGEEETVQDILKSMPADFFDFWKFCSSLKKSKPWDAFSDFGYQLVGVYDLLAKKLPSEQKLNISCHWRYYYDPPEFQTVIKKENEQLFHIGYFRDDPSEMPAAVVSNSAAKDCKISLEGDNLFAAMSSELTKCLKQAKSENLKAKATEIKQKLETFAKENDYSLLHETKKVKHRQKKVVAKTFHEFGIVVPVKDDVGYRPLPESNTKLKNMLQKIVTAKTEESRLDSEEALDLIIADVNFANDECDYGMGLELGTDLFCFGDPSLHSYILSVLPLAYDLLKRSKYADIVREHLKDRKKGCK